MMYVNLVGRLAEDASVKAINGVNFLSLRVAHNFKRKDKECVLWVSVFYPEQKGQELLKHLTKGNRVMCFGPLKVWAYLDGQGVARVDSSMNASILQVVDYNEPKAF